NEAQIDYSQITQSNLVILNELNSIPTGLSTELTEFIKKGGSVAVFPSSKGNVDSYNSFLQIIGASIYNELVKTEVHVEKVDKQHPLLSDVFAKNKNTGKEDLPFAKQYYKLSKNTV